MIEKKKIQRIIPSQDHTGTLRLTGKGKLLTVIESVETAQQLYDIQALRNTPVSPVLQPEKITTRCLLYDTSMDVSCEEISEDLQEVGNLQLENYKNHNKCGRTDNLNGIGTSDNDRNLIT